MKLRLPLLLLGAVLASFSSVQADDTVVSGSSTSFFSNEGIMLLADEPVVFNPAKGEIQVVDQVFEGEGEIQQTGLGTVSLTGVVTAFTGAYLINGGGTLQFNSGVGTVNGKTVLSNNSTVGFNITGSDNVDWSGTFEGEGNILKTGSGTLTIKNLTGAYGSGNVTIQSGTVSVDAGNGSAVLGAEGSTGSITVMNGATLKMVGNDNVFHKAINLQNGSRLYNDDANNLTFNGALNVAGEAKIELKHDKKMTLNGDLIGDANSILTLVINNESPYAGTHSLTLTGSGENFMGQINLFSLNESDGNFSMILVLKSENAASNALVNVAGNAKSASRLMLGVENATIRKISGTANGWIGLADGTASATLTLKEGGVYAGSFGDGLNIVTNGELTLGNTAGVTMKGSIGGTGGVKIASGAQMTFSGVNTYTGSTTLGSGSTLTLVAGASINAQSALVMSDGTLNISTGVRHEFNGLLLSDNITSTISLSGAGTALGLGNISGVGALIISGATSIDGTLTGGGSRVFFQSGTSLYYANASGSALVQGDAIGVLNATGNDASKSYSLSTALTMTNTGKETIADLFIYGLAADGVNLTLAGEGLDITGGLSFNGNGRSMTITGSKLFVGGISATGGGTLAVNSELVIDGKRTTAVSNAAGTNLTLANVTLNDGTLTLSGTVGVTALNVGASGGTISWLNGSTSDISAGIVITTAGTNLVLNAGNGGLVLNSVIKNSVEGETSTIELASGKLMVGQEQVQNFKVDAGAELTFNITGEKKTAGGSFTGNGTVILLNKTSSNWSLTDDQLFGSDWTNFGGHLVMDAGGRQIRQKMTTVIGQALPNGEKAVVEVKNGAQFYDGADVAITRTCDWVMGYGTWGTEGMGALRVSEGATYSGNIAILPGGTWIGGANSGSTTRFTGNISGDKLILGSDGWRDWSIKAELSGDNSGLNVLEILRGTVIANSANALGKNVNLTKNTTKEGSTDPWTASTVNIVADVTLETFNGITGSVIDIAEAKSLTATGTETSTFSGTLTGKGGLNLNGAGMVTLNGDYSAYSGAISVGKDASLTLNGTTAGYSGAITVGEGGRLVAASKTALGTPASIAVNGGTFRYEGEDFIAMPVTLDKGGVLSFAQSQTLSQNVSGKGSIAMDADRSLSIQGNILSGGVGLTFNGGNALTFSGMSAGSMALGVLSVSGTGNTINYETGVNLILNMGGLLLKEGGAVDVENYTYGKSNYIAFAGTTAWEKLEGVTINGGTAAMVDTLGRLTEYQEDVMVGSLVSSGTKSDGSGYTYSSNSQYYGALAGWNVDFSQPFQFASGAFTYGFTMVDDANSGLSAGSFTVSGLMSDDGSTARVVSIIGQAGATDRTVTLTNTGNSFTGNVTVTNATLKADANRPEDIQHAAVTILGKGNTVFLQENATLNLATGDGAYTYANNFTLAGVNSLLTQTEGQHTLTGTITVQGADRGNRVIENALNEGTLTLAGALNVRGENTLTLRTKSGEDSLIVLSLNGNAVLSGLDVQGHVRQTKNTVTVTGGMSLGSNGSYDLTGGTLAVGGVLSSSDAGDHMLTMGNGTTLAVAGDRLEVKRGVTLAFAQEQTSFVLDTGAGTLSFQGSLGTATTNNTLVKRGTGVLELAGNLSTKAMIKVEQGTLSLNEGVTLTSEGDFTVQNGGTLNLSKGSTLTMSSSRTLTFNGSLTGKGSISGVDKLTFGNGTRYAAEMNGQTWAADFMMGSTFSGSLLKHAGNIVFDKGSHIMFDTTLPVSDDSIGISTTGDATVRFNGATVGGTSSSPEVDWDSTQSYIFTLVQSQKELLGSDGQALTQDNLGQSVTVGGDGWGAFLDGELSLSEDGKDLLATVTRNGNTISSFAQTGNQVVVAGALDYAMDNYSSLGLRGTELGDIIQYFNKMGQNIAAQAPEALGMVGGLSNYQALAGQRTDMMRHMEAVRQRAHAGKGLVGISNIPDNSFWAEGTQSYSRVDGIDSSAPGYTAQTWGAAIGVDYLSGPNYSLGVAFAYSNMTVDSNEYAGQTKSDNYYVDLYGRWESGNWNGVVVLSGGTTTVDVKRTLNLGADSYHGTGSTDGTQIIGMAEVAYDWQWEEEGPVLQPYLGMAVGGSKLDGYTESGLGNAGLVIDEQKQTVAQASLGVRLYKQNIDREMQYEKSRWELRAGLVEEFGDTDFATRSSFIGLPGYTMSTKSDDIGRTGLQIGGGFSYAFDAAWSVFGDVNGEFRNGQTNMNSTLGLRCTF